MEMFEPPEEDRAIPDETTRLSSAAECPGVYGGREVERLRLAMVYELRSGRVMLLLMLCEGRCEWPEVEEESLFDCLRVREESEVASKVV